MAKDKNDDKTIDVLTSRQGIKGRPVTGTAMTSAEKQANYRARKQTEQMVNLSVMIPIEQKNEVDQWVKNTGCTMSDVIATMIRLSKSDKDGD